MAVARKVVHITERQLADVKFLVGARVSRQEQLVFLRALRACELREKFATLSDYAFDFGALWAAYERRVELNAIDGGKACWCTHVCFIHDSMRHSRRSLLLEAPKNYLTRASW